MEGTTIYIEGTPLLIDSNNEEVIFDSDSFYFEQVCYINEHPTNGDVYGDYQWGNSFCFPIQNDWRE